MQKAWKEVRQQNIISLIITPLYCNDEVGIASYYFVVEIAGVRHESRGVYFVRLDNVGKATEFRQWWNVVESKF